MSRLSNDDRLTLVDIARRAISSAVLHKSIPDFPIFTGTLSEPRGAFVTLHLAGNLRGCVGQVENPGPLADVVARSAINAALNDTRFAPVRPEEIAQLEIEISVLSALERILPEAIVAGRHGLLVVSGSSRGLLLPQVASERNWTASRLLEETCQKAGLPSDAWRQASTEIYGFTAEIFSERDRQKIEEV
jgi:AmmeMemoRadiSam system protein A